MTLWFQSEVIYWISSDCRQNSLITCVQSYQRPSDRLWWNWSPCITVQSHIVTWGVKKPSTQQPLNTIYFNSISAELKSSLRPASCFLLTWHKHQIFSWSEEIIKYKSTEWFAPQSNKRQYSFNQIIVTDGSYRMCFIKQQWNESIKALIY